MPWRDARNGVLILMCVTAFAFWGELIALAALYFSGRLEDGAKVVGGTVLAGVGIAVAPGVWLGIAVERWLRKRGR